MTIHTDRFNFSFDHPTLPHYVVKIPNVSTLEIARTAFYVLYGVYPGECVWVSRYVSES